MARILDREAVEHGWRILEKRIERDHIVVVVETWPNHSPQRTVRRFQSAGRILRQKDTGDATGELSWGRGYVATTDLEVLDELVARMLDGQLRDEEERQGTT